jgi:transposase InsO family protein
MKSLVASWVRLRPAYIRLRRAIEAFVQYYNQDRYHESLDNVTPADMVFGRYHEIMGRRAQIKQQTLQLRRYQNLNSVPDMNQAI